MELCVVVCPYYYEGLFGTYTSIKRAQIALEHNLADNENVISIEVIDGGYAYQFTTKSGETFRAEICINTLDAEFEEGICQED